jgi:hypothetical protein
MMKGRMLQGLRNHAASLVFGLPPVRRAMTNTMSELSIGYPTSPLSKASGARHSGPAAGERAPLLSPGAPVGAGDSPRFALFAQSDPAADALIARYPELLEEKLRPPFAGDGVWLVRPDGYVAITTARGEWNKIEAYIGWIVGAARAGSARANTAI